MRVLARLHGAFIGSIATRARVGGFVALGFAGIAVAWQVSRSGTTDPIAAATGYADTFGLSFLAPIAALVFGAAAFGDPLEDGTLVYLWLRPVARWRTVAAAEVAVCSLVVPLSVLPNVVGVAFITSDRRMIAATLVATTLAALAYSSLFVLVGLVTTRALVWGIGYLLIIEQFVARGGRALGALSIHAHVISVFAWLGDTEADLAYFTPLTGALVSTLVVGIAAAGAVLRLETADIA